MFFVAGYDYLFFKDKYVVHKLKSEYNLNAYYLPQCCNPLLHNVTSLNKEDEQFYNCDITNAGNLYPSRIALYKHLTQYDFKMWGSKPSYWLNIPEIQKIITGKVVFNNEKSKAFQAAKICLNNMHLAEIDGVNKRTFEIPACGGFQIATYNNEINNLFEEGKEIVTYKTYDDLIEKIDYYLDPKNEVERKKIADAGHARATKDHTYENRLNEIINTCIN
jgi:spore maturation protein CgeB